MSRLRHNRVTGGRVLIAPRRGRRPQMRALDTRTQQRLRFDPACPFCPGHEDQLPGIIAEATVPGETGWRVRVVPNKFPAVQLAEAASATVDPGQDARPGCGVHEVIIESPWHDAEPATMTAADMSAAVSVYRDRTRMLLSRDEIAAAILFRNYGASAGASRMHPHAQVIGLDFVPPKLAALDDWAQRYHAEHGRCVVCEELAIERRARKRIVEESEDFVAMAPFASEYPFEIWVVPKQHQASFAALADDVLPGFAALVGRTLLRLQMALEDPPYNFVIDSAPKAARTAPHWHWRLRIAPNVVTWGGFELGTGLPINPSSPEDAAFRLREAEVGV